jgi:hypothetical protein
MSGMAGMVFVPVGTIARLDFIGVGLSAGQTGFLADGDIGAPEVEICELNKSKGLDRPFAITPMTEPGDVVEQSSLVVPFGSLAIERD